MFWKFIEFLIRIIYFRRFRSAKKIGDAGALLGEGKPEEALVQLERAGQALHESLLPLYAFTRGKILTALHRDDEAEKAFQTVVLSDPKNARADLELALLSGTRFRFEECRQWLDRAIGKEDEEVQKQAEEIRDLLDRIESGQREQEFADRAEKMASAPVLDGTLGTPPNLELLDRWIESDPDKAREALDDVAILAGQAKVDEGGSWKLNLSIDQSVVLQPDGSEFNPFEFVANRF